MKTAINKLRKALPAVKTARWVFLAMAAYTVLGTMFLGSACLIYSTTGIPCPGCGGTRAALQLLHGDILGSLWYHPLLLPAAAALLVYFFVWLKHDKTPRWAGKMLAALGIALAAAYIVRMALFFMRAEPMLINERAVAVRLIHLLRRQ
ncbi:MAG: DUF2752 domain-containing protein [Oscillospiraceae bacterium]|nr:DUF2752 domain-containing protein [Oscillospiraceae bacterium]